MQIRLINGPRQGLRFELSDAAPPIIDLLIMGRMNHHRDPTLPQDGMLAPKTRIHRYVVNRELGTAVFVAEIER